MVWLEKLKILDGQSFETDYSTLILLILKANMSQYGICDLILHDGCLYLSENGR